ncbi:MAG: HTH domain-containing protein [Flavobacteriaceae bacterium]|nr:MAG: HTH domain-containing protein [Flavobacteriaceae bacterium]
MKFIERKQKLDYLLEMIQNGRCFSLSQISGKFEVSKRTAKRMIACLREEGYKIIYCRVTGKFWIKEE